MAGQTAELTGPEAMGGATGRGMETHNGTVPQYFPTGTDLHYPNRCLTDSGSMSSRVPMEEEFGASPPWGTTSESGLRRVSEHNFRWFE